VRPAGSSAAVALLVALTLALPPSAAAQGTATSPFSPLPPATGPTSTATTPTATTATTTSTTGTGLSGGDAVAIAIGALVVLGGISFFIWHDARRRAPVRRRVAAATAGEGGRSGSKPRVKSRKLSPAERRRRKRGRAK
jgi:hypothetical protein